MQLRVITFLVLISLAVPFFSNAMFMIPSFNLKIIVNTQEQDGTFSYAANEYSDAFFIASTPINIQTENFSGKGEADWLSAWSNSSYYLKQQDVLGFKVDSINCTSDNGAQTFTYNTSEVYFQPLAWSTITCTFNNKKVDSKTPVLIVPGIMGTELKSGNTLLWADVASMFLSELDNFMDPLAFNQNLTPSDPGVTILDVIRKKEKLNATLINYTDGLIKEFSDQGYKENENLFLFPYDWRYGESGKYADGTTNIDLLKQKIVDILQQTGSSKVDVIAHSNGGLLVKKYVMDNPTNHHIGKAVFVGVPNTGAPRTIKALIEGDDMDINFANLGLSPYEMKKISQNMPIAYDLLPSQTYYNVKGSFIKMVDTKNPFNPFDNTQTDLDYSQFKSYLTDNNLNSTAILNSQTLHTTDFDNYDLRTAGIDLYNIVGCKTATMAGFTELQNHDLVGNNYKSYSQVDLKVGDGTVPIESATNLPVSQANKFYVLSTKHSDLLSQVGSRQKIVNIITGSNLDVNNKVTQDISRCELNGKGFSVFSPVNIFFTDQYGNRLGLTEDGSIINEIPGADFEIWGEHKFIFVPTDAGQIYTTSLTGTGNGTYTIKAEDIQNSQTTKTEVFSNLPVTTSLTGGINISDIGTTLTVQQTLTSQAQTVLPDTTTIGEQTDFIPPISSAILTGTSTVVVQITAKDNDGGAGVLSINYNLDNVGFQKVLGDTANFTVSTEGKHAVQFFATDKSGNNEQIQTAEFIIDKTAPEAIIEFDSVTKDLKFTGKDNISTQSEITVQDKDDTITLTDKAGNATEIKFRDKDRRNKMSAEIKSIKYNSKSADISKNEMSFSWNYDKDKKGDREKDKIAVLKKLTQHIKSKKDFTIDANYDSKSNTTKIAGKDQSGKINKTETGLKIIKIATDNGDLNWSY